jgi:protein TonB
MTALTARPPRTAANLALPSRHAEDRRLLALALLGAGVLHGLVLLVPVPETRPAIVPEAPSPPLELNPYDIPPPPLEPPPPRAAGAGSERLIPVPDAPRSDPEPVREPYPEPDPTDGIPAAPGWADYTPEAPPPAVVEEGTPGLILPRALPGRPQPEYPWLAVRSRVAGTVILRAVITADGSVESIELIETSQPDLGFSEAAIEAVSAWRYEPGLLDGRPVAVALNVVVSFDLQ